MQAVLGNSPASLGGSLPGTGTGRTRRVYRTLDEGQAMEALLREYLEAEVNTEEGTTQFAKRGLLENYRGVCWPSRRLNHIASKDGERRTTRALPSSLQPGSPG